ncbi:Thioesterase super [Branchiostoma belcheri]|nr:Thioesterase super [Branchiostoma belcheri]
MLTKLIHITSRLHPVTMATRHLSSSSSDDLWLSSSYKFFLTTPTRWMDNDQFGHVNNTTYYSYFDTVINRYLIHHCHINYDIIRGLMVHNECDYRRPLQYPDVPVVGMFVGKIGRSSVTYNVGLFPSAVLKGVSGEVVKIMDKGLFVSELTKGGLTEDVTALAVGSCVHVFVDSRTNKPTPLPENLKMGLQKILSNVESRL